MFATQGWQRRPSQMAKKTMAKRRFIDAKLTQISKNRREAQPEQGAREAYRCKTQTVARKSSASRVSLDEARKATIREARSRPPVAERYRFQPKVPRAANAEIAASLLARKLAGDIGSVPGQKMQFPPYTRIKHKRSEKSDTKPISTLS